MIFKTIAIYFHSYGWPLLLKISKQLNNQNTIYVKFEYLLGVIVLNRKKMECMKNNKRVTWSGYDMITSLIKNKIA